jgi:hypothetical protein
MADECHSSVLILPKPMLNDIIELWDEESVRKA